MPYKDREKQLESQRRHYLKNKQKRLDWNRVRKQEIKEIIRQYKEKPCADCGIPYPYYVMELDHLPGAGKKHSHPADLYRTMWGNERLMEELGKCEPVCANCHRERTFGRAKKRGSVAKRLSHQAFNL